MNTSANAMLLGTFGLSIAAMAPVAPAQTAPDSAAAVVAVVRVPKPWYAPRSVVVNKMRDTVADYERLPGLVFKAYALERQSADYGGLYTWRSRAQAQAWFNAAWFERVRKERGAEASVRYFDAPVSIDNTPGGTALNRDSAAVGTLVEIAVPAGVSRERVVSEFSAAVPAHQKAPGLLRKHFILSDKGTFGGVYLWKDEASARAWFNDAWHARVSSTYGQDAKIEWFDTPILLPSVDPANLAAALNMHIAAP